MALARKLIVLTVLICGFASAAIACIPAPSISNGTISFPEIDDPAKIQPIKLYASKDFSGRPVLELNKDGMFYNGEIVCIWGNMKDCAGIPIIVKEGSGSSISLQFDEKEYYLRVASMKDDRSFKAESNIFTTIFRGRRLYYDIESYKIDIMSANGNQKC